MGLRFLALEMNIEPVEDAVQALDARARGNRTVAVGTLRT
jgi:hypothetical protein